MTTRAAVSSHKTYGQNRVLAAYRFGVGCDLEADRLGIEKGLLSENLTVS